MEAEPGLVGDWTFLHSLLDMGVQFLTSSSSSLQLEGTETASQGVHSTRNTRAPTAAQPPPPRRSPGALPAHLARLVGGAEPASLALALPVVSGTAVNHRVLV